MTPTRGRKTLPAREQKLQTSQRATPRCVKRNYTGTLRGMQLDCAPLVFRYAGLGNDPFHRLRMNRRVLPVERNADLPNTFRYRSDVEEMAPTRMRMRETIAAQESRDICGALIVDATRHKLHRERDDWLRGSAIYLTLAERRNALLSRAPKTLVIRIDRLV